MLPIFASWCFMLGIFLTCGVAADSIFKINSRNPILKIVVGIIFQTVVLTTAAFFIPIGFWCFAFNILFTMITAYFFRRKIFIEIQAIRMEWQRFSSFAKISMVLIVLAALFKSAQSPFILDNESYYVQTIKWLNEYGFVKGIANLNVAYGQTSPWHILQSGFNFNFLTNRLNDINGFLMVVCSFFFMAGFDREKKLWVGFLFFFNVLLFQFIDSPSPDFPLIVVGQVVFYQFLNNEDNRNARSNALFIIYLIFVKITVVPLLFLVLWSVYKSRKESLFLILSSLLFFTLWVAKNTVLFGYPLFPTSLFAVNADWKIPEALLNNLNNAIRNHEFMTLKGYETFSVMDKFLIWIRFGGINSVFNKGILVLFAVVVFIPRMRFERFRALYVVLLLHFVTVFLVSPQFRFFLIDFIFLAAVLAEALFQRLRIKEMSLRVMVFLSVLLPFFTVYIIDFKLMTSNKLNLSIEKPRWTQLYLPYPNSRYDGIRFIETTEGNLKYYSPEKIFFSYGTANGPLPCTSRRIVKRFKARYHFIPQLRTGRLDDGFYSSPVK
ncbi:hypothetical protein [Flavobacterium sp.]|uniref:LIC_10190 family membrane protein n=1 Tax=Flavobacterium sp. TaxID=239 RepID=UPI00261DB468|nr:hypothetical protein [Flavobacterium sp.]